MVIRFPRALLHPICLVGLVVAAVGFAASTVALIADINSHEPRPYQGILTFVLYPSLMGGGLAIVALGLLHERRRKKRFAAAQEAWRPALDLSRGAHRAGLGVLVLGLAVFVVLSITGSYRAYEFTESPTFCGAMCHTAMNPQYVAHQDSPHAHVACAHCHVGPGMDSYVAAKVSGLRQVYQVVTDGFHRPIHAPKDRIPGAAETCTHCHWAGQDWGTLLDDRVRYGYDLFNTRRSLQVLPRVGSDDGGIHAHAQIENKVWFRLDGAEGQHGAPGSEIPWVQVERPDGTTVVYEDSETELAPRAVEALHVRQMDCLDCHNRPAHRFASPDEALNRALESGDIDPSLPYIKKVGVEALMGRYASTEEAREGIREAVESYYRENFDGQVLAREASLADAIASLQKIHERNVFPELALTWNTYPSHDGHRSSPGCFRCHDGKHVSKEGDVLPSQCDLCHTFVARERGSSSMREIPADASSLHPFRDPEHQKLDCWKCHQGTESPYASCHECHGKDVSQHAMRFECSICHKPGETVVRRTSCAACHPTGDSPMHAVADHAECVACHQPHDWAVEGDAGCAECHADLSQTKCAGPQSEAACTSCHSFGGVGFLMGGLPGRH